MPSMAVQVPQAGRASWAPKQLDVRGGQLLIERMPVSLHMVWTLT